MVKKEKKTAEKPKNEKLVVNFNSLLEDDKETVQLEVTYSKALQMMLRKVAVSGEREFVHHLGVDESGNSKEKVLKRTKVKTAIWNGFSSEGRDLLFIVDLIKDKKYIFEFYDISLLEKTISLFCNNVNRAIELVGQCSNIKHKVSFVVE